MIFYSKHSLKLSFYSSKYSFVTLSIPERPPTLYISEGLGLEELTCRCLKESNLISTFLIHRIVLQDMEDMQTNLGKLKALSEDDKLENTKLRSRIDEQCQLIMVLKQKADDGTIKVQTLDRMNKELSDFRDKVGNSTVFPYVTW